MTGRTSEASRATHDMSGRTSEASRATFMTDVVATNETILVVGGGISGMTAALEAAECGKDVVLVEKNPSLGGRVTQLYKYFPKLCHPTCGMEINLRRLRAQKRIRVLTLAEVKAITGKPGDYTATIRISPRYVNENCTACGECEKAVSAEISNPFNYGMDKIKAAYLPFSMAYPPRYVIDPSIIGTPEAEKAKAACKYDAVDLNMKEATVNFKVGAVVWATGWKPYEAKNVAFIQCAGSRDRNHLKHCSRICCMASLKQSTYVREKFVDAANVSIYYIDIRAIDRFEDFYKKIQADPKVKFIKSKVANITEDKATGNPILHGVDTEGYHRYDNQHDLVVLAIGMEPSVDASRIMPGVAADASGFIDINATTEAVFGAGCASNALDVNRSVQNATAAALRAIQVVNRVSRAEA